MSVTMQRPYPGDVPGFTERRTRQADADAARADALAAQVTRLTMAMHKAAHGLRSGAKLMDDGVLGYPCGSSIMCDAADALDEQARVRASDEMRSHE